MKSEDLAAAANAFPPEKPQTLTLDDDRPKQERQSNGSDEDLEAPEDAAINVLHGEIRDLRRDRSELQRRIDDMLADMERSEVATKALAAHASSLEGDLVRTQEDLASASSAEDDAEKAAISLRSEIRNLEKKIEDLEAERGVKDGEIQSLKEEVRVSDERRAMKEEELKGRCKELELRIDELMNMTMEEVNLRVSRKGEVEMFIRGMKEKNSELEGDQESWMKVALGDTAKELKERNSELEGKNAELLSLLREAAVLNVSWAVVTGTLAAVLASLYLRHGRLGG